MFHELAGLCFLLSNLSTCITFFGTIRDRDQMTLILIDTCKVTYRSKGSGVFIYCKLNILHILYIITHVTIIKHLLTYLLTNK